MKSGVQQDFFKGIQCDPTLRDESSFVFLDLEYVEYVLPPPTNSHGTFWAFGVV